MDMIWIKRCKSSGGPMNDTPEFARLSPARSVRAGAEMLRKHFPPLAPELQTDFDRLVDRDLARLLPVLGPLCGLFVLLFWAWDTWIDATHAALALRIRVALVVLGALAYAQGRLRWRPTWRCAWLYATHAGAVMLCAALPAEGLLLALPGVTGAMFMLAMIEPRPRHFLLAVSAPSVLLFILAAQRLPAPQSQDAMLLYALSLPLALGVALANLALRRRAFLAETALLHTVRHDSLSGALSRAYLAELGKHDLALALRYGHPLSLAMLDIDWFKRVNDTYGHASGDLALCALVQTCKSALRASDYIGRLGGEEFVCVMPEARPEDALACAERIRKGIAALTLPTAAGPLCFTVSIGIATLGKGLRDWDSLLGAADAAMYEAKSTGRNRTVLADV
jgi:diguanylate cyclase (GGDEF)-like protein